MSTANIQRYKIQQVKPIYQVGKGDEVIAVNIKIEFCSDWAWRKPAETGYLTCEGAGGAIILWEQDPSEYYEDQIAFLWNSNLDISDELTAKQCNIYPGYIYPVDNCVDFYPEDSCADSAAEQELWYKASQLYKALS